MKRRWILLYTLTLAAGLVISYLGSRAVNVISQNSPIQRNFSVVIDAGHGGVDGGAVSCTGIPESKYNLDLALRLNDVFRLIGYDTRLIRTSDVSVYTKGETIAQKKISDLKERVRIVNETENALLISIHQNIFSDSRYSGAQVFYADDGYSKKLAERIQQDIVLTINPGSRRQCKKSTGIYLMENITKPGVLIECGFLSNPQEEAKLQSKEYQQKLCCVIASAVGSFLSNT